MELDGKQLNHMYFFNPWDVALEISTDGFTPWKRRNSTAWPLILFNYNLPPEIWFHVEHILALEVILGPRKPVDVDLFLWLAVLEFIQLMEGITIFDILQSELFIQYAYVIVDFGDMPAMSLLLHMKGHNGISPCWMCKILSIQIPGSQATTHYIPISRVNHPSVLANPQLPQVYDLKNLPLWFHQWFLQQAHEVESAMMNTAANDLAKCYRIKSVPILAHLSFFCFPASFLFDFMHLIFENLLLNLVLHWTGEFKCLDEGCEDYILTKVIWEGVSQATAQSGSTILSAYRNWVLNIASNHGYFSAEMWSFWMLYLGPILLCYYFWQPKYFKHFMLLVCLITLCLQFKITNDEVTELQDGFMKWVQSIKSAL